ncbi:MAG TPA: DUF190 domain-containing protein, partial [Leptolyngbyaceae cyanobacterium M65_K2018_010]|nr:DUF190 domain-containing protein [Leptolyngbyaceae cyanobacterium M65_K2018_010]
YERLTIYLGEAEHWQGKPTYLALVEAARQHGLMGATVLRGLTGYGKKNHDRKVLLGMIELSSDLPMVITLIDNREKIEGFLPIVQSMVGGGIVLRDTVEVVHPAPLTQSP